jgi:phosphoglycerate kinase
MLPFQTLDTLDVSNRRVLLRADLNVPIKGGKVTDASRIEEVVPTIQELLNKASGVIVVSHLGRPDGKVVPEMSLKPVVDRLAAELDPVKVNFVPDWNDGNAEKAASSLARGEVLVLENIRYLPGEEKNDPVLAKRLAGLADVYVDDAFSCAHRAHASIEAVARLLPAAAGRLMEKELAALTNALDNPQRPVTAIVGGNKISTKLSVLENLIKKVNTLAIGGAMANTFILAEGGHVGKSLAEGDMLETARRVRAVAKEIGCEIVLPVDAVVASALAPNQKTSVAQADAIPADQMALDVGPKTVARFTEIVKASKTVVWNGPLGAFETKPFDAGTNAVASAAAEATEAGKLLSVAGGGDTMAAMVGAGVRDRLSYVSLAGGAFLEWLEGLELPGVAVLRTKK